MTEKWEKEQARKEFKEKGLIYFWEILRQEWRDDPKACLYWFTVNFIGMFLFIQGVGWINDDLRYCDIIKQDDTIEYKDYKYRLILKEWNKL